MDIKILILVGICFVAIYIIYTEFVKSKQEFKQELAKINKHTDDQLKELRKGLQADLTVCVNKIKSINTDSIQQVRKIGLIEKQPINKISNYYTENEEDHDGMSPSPHGKDMSDTSLMHNILSKNNVIMSQVMYGTQINKKGTSNLDENKNKDKKSENSCYMSNKDDTLSDNNLIPQLINPLEFIMKQHLNLVPNDLIVILDNAEDCNTSESKNELPPQVCIEVEAKIHKIESPVNSKQEEQVCEKINELPVMTTVNQTVCTPVVEQKNEPTGQPTNISPSTTSTTSISTCTPLISSIKVPEIVNNKHIDIDLDDSDSENGNKYDSLMDNITIGSQKSGKSSKKFVLGSSTGKSMSNNITMKPSLDELSVNTGEISTLNISTVKSIEKYNMIGLKKMASSFGISTSAKIDGKWKPMNKTELYNKIVEYLNNKKSEN